MSLQSVAKLVVTEAERYRRRTLIEAIAPQRILQELPLIIGDRCAKIAG